MHTLIYPPGNSREPQKLPQSKPSSPVPESSLNTTKGGCFQMQIQKDVGVQT